MDRPIILPPNVIRQCRQGIRTHLVMPASWKPGVRAAFGAEAKAKAALVASSPSAWASLQAGDRLWVREELAVLIDRRNPMGSRSHFKMEINTGKIPIPGGAMGSRYERYSKPAKDLERSDSRFTMHVVRIARFNAHDVSWDAMKLEGPLDAHSTKGAWWKAAYGLFLPWEDNPDCVGITFTWQNGNIDTGREWIAEPFDRRALPLARSIMGTQPVND